MRSRPPPALVVGRGGVAGEQHDGHVGRVRLRPQTPAERDAVDVRQRDVEHDHVGRRSRYALHRLGGAAGLVDLDVDDLECRPQEHAEVGVVVDDEKADAARADAAHRSLLDGAMDELGWLVRSAAAIPSAGS